MKKRTCNFLLLVALLLLFTTAYSQQIQVKGTVYDASTQSTLPGVNVVVKGSTLGAITDVDGKFVIAVGNTSARLQFSFIGYLTTEVLVGNQIDLRIEMKSQLQSVDEVVVIGYGTQKKSDLTGSIGIVNTQTMAKMATSDVTKALQGKVSGVSVQSSGDPGATPKVKIRGVTSFTNNDPLYVIDGVFAPINDIPTEAIESIQILKDASAAAIYGSRAANGVVIITTYRGNKGQIKVNYDGYYGFQDIVKRMEVCKREDYQMLVNELTMNAKAYPQYKALKIFPANDPTNPNYVDDVDTDWQKEMFKTGYIHNQTFNFSGGTEVSNFSINLNYLDQTGTVVGNGPNYKRYGISVNSDHKLGRFKFGESLHYTYADQSLMTFLHTGTMLFYTTNAIPTVPVYDEDGNYFAASSDLHGAYSANVVGMNSLIENNTDRYRLIGNIYGEYEIIPDLKYKISLSYERTDWRDYQFEPEYKLGWFAGYSNTVAKMNDNRGMGYTGTFEQTLSYNKEIGKLNFSALAGHSALNSYLSRLYGHAEGFSKPYFKQLSNGTTKALTGDEYQSRLISFFGRAILSYDDKYLLTATIRRDGSSRFSPTNRWGNFPSVAVAWKVHNESFMESVNFISQLKVRASYGVLGNQNIGDYRYQGYINPYASYVLNGVLVPGAAQYIPSSGAIKWEQSKTTNTGIDLGLMDNRIMISAEYYIKQVDDLLGTVPTPTHMGWYDWDSPVTNSLSVKNQGLELEISYRKNTGEFQYSIGANISTLKNEVLSLGAGINPIDGNWSRTDVGTEVGELYGYVVEKIFQDKSEIDALNATAADKYYQERLTDVGDFMFKDLSGPDGTPDGEITDADQTHIGSAIPNLYFGLNISAFYKDFDLTISAQGSSGNMVVNTIGNGLRSGAGYENMSTDLLDRWRVDNPDTGRPRIIKDDPNHNGRASAYWLEKGDYLRFSNIELGYTLPRSLIAAVKISSVRIYGSLQNALTLTQYTGFDPEFNNDGLFSRGTDNGAAANKTFTDFAGGLPTPRTILFGVKIGF